MNKKITTSFIDVHNHILPNVDDGAQSMEVSIQMLEIAYEEGIRGIIVTPHYHPGRSMMEYDTLQDRFLQFKEVVKKVHPDMKLFLGREVYYTSDVLELIENGSKFTIEETKYILIEYSPRTDYNYVRMSVNNVLQAGFIPIIAHIERYECMLDDLDYVVELRDMGAVIQINAASVLGKSGRQLKKFTKQLLKYAYVDLIATDSHSAGSRSPRLMECANYIAKKYGMDYAKTLLHDNPEKIIQGKYLEDLN